MNSNSFQNIIKISSYTIFLDFPIGSGSFGEVYLANDSNQQRKAVKMIAKSFITQNKKLHQAFLTQVSIMKKLKHVNVIEFIQAFENESHYFIVMQYCQKGSLQKVLKRRKVINEQQAKEILIQICHAFMYFVQQGIVHRDLKPSNILFKGNTLKIIDFGLSKINHNLKSQCSDYVGTPPYMSWELLTQNSYTSKCDIWSLGIIYYQMLHGKTPYEHKSTTQLINKIQSEEIKYRQGISIQSQNFLMKCLAKDQKDRISWDQLFEHSIFSGKFQEYGLKKGKFENKMKFIMNEIRFIISIKNIDLRAFFTNLGYGLNEQLHFDQFKEIMLKINDSLVDAQLNHMFTFIDKNQNELISFQQFMEVFENYNLIRDNQITLTDIIEIAKISPFIKVDVEIKQPLVNTSIISQKTLQKLENIFVQIFRHLSLKNLTLSDIFKKYDVNNSGKVFYRSFCHELLKIDPTLKQNDLQLIFSTIDTDKSDSIQFQQFNNYYCHINNISPSMIKDADLDRLSTQRNNNKKPKSSPQISQTKGSFILYTIQKHLQQNCLRDPKLL